MKVEGWRRLRCYGSAPQFAAEVLEELTANEEIITLYVKAQDPEVRANREKVCRRVRDYFGHQLQIHSGLKVLCFFDDEDLASLRRDPPLGFGRANRGLHERVRGGISHWPEYVQELLAVDDPDSFAITWPFSSLIYLHGSTCETEIGMTITFAHELQHFMQYAGRRRLWAANMLLMNLEKYFPYRTDFKFLWEIPIEIEARVVAKQAAETLFGGERVRQYVDARVGNPVNADDAKDWEFFRGLRSSDSYDLLIETKKLVQRYEPLLRKLQEHRDLQRDPDFSTLDFAKAQWWK